jgi:hypothetical protein
VCFASDKLPRHTHLTLGISFFQKLPPPTSFHLSIHPHNLVGDRHRLWIRRSFPSISLPSKGRLIHQPSVGTQEPRRGNRNHFEKLATESSNIKRKSQTWSSKFPIISITFASAWSLDQAAPRNQISSYYSATSSEPHANIIPFTALRSKRYATRTESQL